MLVKPSTFAKLRDGAHFIRLHQASKSRKDEFEVLVKTMFEFQIIEGGTRYNAISTTNGNFLTIEDDEPVLPIATTSKVRLISRKPYAYSPISQ